MNADIAEDDAAFAVEFAYGAIEEAEYEVLNAALARMEADELGQRPDDRDGCPCTQAAAQPTTRRPNAATGIPTHSERVVAIWRTRTSCRSATSASPTTS